MGHLGTKGFCLLDRPIYNDASLDQNHCTKRRIGILAIVRTFRELIWLRNYPEKGLGVSKWDAMHSDDKQIKIIVMYLPSSWVLCSSKQ